MLEQISGDFAWGWQGGPGLLIGILALGYGAQWWHVHQVAPEQARWRQLFCFLLGLTALTVALVYPLPEWSNYLLAMRSAQKALICMVAAPLLWLGAPVIIFTRHIDQPLLSPRWRGVVTSITQPVFLWFLYFAVLLFWHDAQMAGVIIGSDWLRFAAPWLLLIVALLFWWPVLDAHPRLHATFPAWLLIIYLLGIEIANMIAGVTIAFAHDPIYPHYPAMRALLGDEALPFSQMTDQILGGAIVWVFGSFVYITGIILILHRLFMREGSNSPQPLPNWDDNAKFIAPGLEDRVAQNQLRGVDLRHR